MSGLDGRYYIIVPDAVLTNKASSHLDQIHIATGIVANYTELRVHVGFDPAR